MPTVLLDSFDHYLNADLTDKYPAGDDGLSGGGVSIATGALRHGVQGLQFAGVGAMTDFFTYNLTPHKTIGGGTAGPIDEGGFGFAFRFDGAFQDVAESHLVMFRMASAFPRKMYLLRVLSSGGLEIRTRTDNIETWSTATTVATFEVDADGNDLTLNDGQWHYLEGYFGYPATNTDNIYELHADGFSFGSSTATLGLSPGGSSQTTRFRIYHQDQDLDVDDLYLYVDDVGDGSKFLNPIRIDALLPDSIGRSGNDSWNPSSAVDHYTLIDDAYDDSQAVKLTGKITANSAGPQLDDWGMADASTTEPQWKAMQVNAFCQVDGGANDSADVRCFAIDDADGAGGDPTPDHYLTVANAEGSTTYPMNSAGDHYYRWLVGPGDVLGLSRNIEPNWQRMVLGLEKLNGTNTLFCAHFAVEIALPLTSDANVRMTQLVVEVLVASPAVEDTDDRTAGATFINCTFHGNGRHGCNGGQTLSRCTAYGNGGDGMLDPVNVVHASLYGNGGAGVKITHGKPATLLHVSAVSNSGYAFDLSGEADVAVPFVHMDKCSHFGGLGRINHPAARDATVYDSDGITLSADPFVDGDNGDFALTGPGGEQLKNFDGTPFFELPATKSYHDHQAAQHLCPSGGGTANKFTDNQIARSVN